MGTSVVGTVHLRVFCDFLFVCRCKRLQASTKVLFLRGRREVLRYFSALCTVPHCWGTLGVFLHVSELHYQSLSGLGRRGLRFCLFFVTIIVYGDVRVQMVSSITIFTAARYPSAVLLIAACTLHDILLFLQSPEQLVKPPDPGVKGR